MRSLKTFEFEIEIDADDLYDELVDIIFKAGCDDGLLGQHGDVVSVSFIREARTRDEAIDKAIRQLVQAGMPVISTRASAHFAAN